ncbi:hypothetical protein EDD11_009464 [Mortierella claussenii]|nr:hypothetical protein EDD11_009464 [Mortierella claussenii]
MRSMEGETMVQPRARLLELKSSADFPSEEFNHSIKTWVNMASLLVKQGNMAESNKDDENAYISYVRACLIITKIIPHQALYSSMMNDIVCIDLRQKILGIVSRMGHLERRLLKQFEQENQERMARLERSPAVYSATTHARIRTASHQSERSMERAFERVSLDDYEQDARDQYQQNDMIVPRMTFHQEPDHDERVVQHHDETEESEEDEIEEDLVEVSFEIPAATKLSLELDSQAYRTHHRPSTLTESDSSSGSSRSGSPYFHQVQYQQQDGTKPSLDGMPTLKKKSSNEDDRSLLSPECQPNYSAMPSALFARQREGCHVRRCSSTDAIRTSVHFPATVANAHVYPQHPMTFSPAVPPRSDKRCSMGASLIQTPLSIDRKSRTGGAIGLGAGAIVPDYRGTASSMEERGSERTVYAREVIKSRFSNRRTMSFESNSFGGSTAAGSGTPHRTGSSRLKKSSSISRLHASSSKGQRDMPSRPTPRASVDKLTWEAAAAAADGYRSSSLSMSVSSGSMNQQFSAPSSDASTPIASPQSRTTNPHVQTESSVMHHHQPHQYQHHTYSNSLASITSDSCTAMAVDVSCSAPSLYNPSRAPLDSSNKLTTYPQPSTAIVSSSSSSSSSPTSPAAEEASVSSSPTPSSTHASVPAFGSATAVGKTAGLLRKIRSRPKMKDQVFEMMANPAPTASPPPPYPGSTSPSALAAMMDSQQQQQQHLMSIMTHAHGGHARQLSGSLQHQVSVVV